MTHMLVALRSELVFAVRRLAADRWAAGAAILAVAVGAGLNTAVFAAAYGLLVRPLPYADPARLAVMSMENRVKGFVTDMRLEELDEWARGLRGTEQLAAYASTDVIARGAGDPLLVHTALVGDNFFDLLGAPALRGRLFTAGDRTGVAVVGERFARRVFGRPEDALGRTLTIDQAAVSIVAVVARDVAFPTDRTDLWLPLTALPSVSFAGRTGRQYFALGRLASGVTPAQAHDELQRLVDARDAARREAHAKEEGPAPSAPRLDEIMAASLVPIQESRVKALRPVLWTFAAGVTLVLLIACANVATILVGRAIARQRAFAIQRALGADASHLIASMLAESLVISIAGAVVGLGIAAIGVRLLHTMGAGLVAGVDAVTMDWPVFAFACGLSLVVAGVAAIVPARRGLGASVAGLRVTSVSPGRTARRTRAVLAVAQVALAVVVLAGGALLVGTVVRLLSTDIGVDPRGAVSVRLMMTETTSFQAAHRGPLIDEVLRRVRALPGVQHAGAGTNLPPAREQVQIMIRMITGTRDDSLMLSLAALTPGYLPAVGARLLRGRMLDDADVVNPHSAVVLSETAARHLFGSLDVVGRPLPLTLPAMPKGTRASVVGVVQDVKFNGLERPAGATVYIPWRALPAGELFLAVRTAGDPTALAGTVRRLLREIDPTLPAVDSQPLVTAIERTIADRRLRALLGGSMALLAFAVALVGLAGGLLHAVTERRRELAIRSALGATPRRAIRMVLAEGAAIVGAGLVVGLLASIGFGRALSGLLYGVTPSDPVTLALVAGLVAVAALTVCYLPARRAAKADPLELLRAE